MAITDFNLELFNALNELLDVLETQRVCFWVENNAKLLEAYKQACEVEGRPPKVTKLREWVDIDLPPLLDTDQ